MANELELRFDYAANELIKVARYSAAYLLDDMEFKNEYLHEINEIIRLIRNDFKIAIYHYGEGRWEYWKDAKKFVKEIEMELEVEKSGYEQGRKKDRKTYLNTQEYSGKGFLFYGQNGLKFVGGIVQLGAGIMAFGARRGGLRGLESKGMGVLAIATGVGDAVEGASNIIYEWTDGYIDQGNPTKFLTEKGFSSFGADEGSGELAYDIADFGVGLYFGFAAFAKYNPSKRIINLPVETKSGLEKVPLLHRLFTPKGGVRLYKYMEKDYNRKMFTSGKAILTYKAGNAAIKAYLMLDKYLFNEKDENN
ncbi:DUF4225 domain-containing protein [Xenorhabdus bovienii]|uniref:DUF4225 domain-containing protein n=3 Tax=Xenorhabdus bovienii TaxID=40576 RepID=UPI0023B1C66B|nr:DUF4225 domain-containing protein [Xenorhabdus bovienii]MDE9463433.1 DUF4225 domain-containing protein [Xenorhabdus bovienii]MDE9471207.1 DUF4225 domain-containing protein [Xenorhabdus bovienii]MDE9479378.1 DUF4225 domain-containing protein [Xenorhabdus bovienii]MDE9532199.1 DUF4225 domain-containing protein [Xenorhabdus bovienii]